MVQQRNVCRNLRKIRTISDWSATKEENHGKWKIERNDAVQKYIARICERIIYFFTYFSTVIALTSCVFFPVGLSSLARHFQQVY